jgi:hypothetical protein
MKTFPARKVLLSMQMPIPQRPFPNQPSSRFRWVLMVTPLEKMLTVSERV